MEEEEYTVISVAIATYNGEKYIEKQLKSILEQSIEVDEVIICDDKSTDDTVDVIRKFIKNNKLFNKWKIWINEKNLGYIRNFIKAITLTKGDYIFLSDQDDIFYPNKFKTMIEYFEKNPQCVLLNANYEIIDEKGDVNENFRTLSRNKRISKVDKIDFRKWLYESSFPGFSMGVRACLRDKIANANLEGCYGHDQLIGLLAINMDGNYRMNEVLSGYRIHSENTTGGKNVLNNYSITMRIEQKEKEQKEYKQLRRMIEVNNIKNIDYHFLDMREKELKKRIKLLEKRKIFGLFIMLITSKAYPKGTILGDCLYLIRGKK